MIAASKLLPRVLWRWVFLFLISAGVLASFFSLNTAPNRTSGISDTFPLGLITGLDVICGLAVSAGAFGIALSGYVLNDPVWKAVVRPSILIGTSGYVVALLGAFGEIAVPSRAWPLVLHFVSSRSVVAGCIWVLAMLALWARLEFVSANSLRSESHRALLHRTLILLAAVATLLTNSQQWHLASMLVRAGNSPLWSSPRLPVLFFASSMCAGLAVLLFASIRSNSNLAVGGIMKALALLLFLYLALRLNDMVEFGALRLTITAAGASYFWAEIFLLVAAVAWLCDPRPSPGTLYAGTVMALAGVLLNRLNSCITALNAAYHASWIELAIAYSLVAAGVAMYVVGTKFLQVFPVEADAGHQEMKGGGHV